MPSQSPYSVFLVRPASPGINTETSSSNAFQTDIHDMDSLEVRDLVLDEFDNMVALLEANDIEVKVFEDSRDPVKPDAHFPNNWISTHSNGNIMLYPMMAVNRRQERRTDIVKWLEDHYVVSSVYNEASKYEEKDEFLEGTGSMVIDYMNNLVYACLSPRTSEELLKETATRLGCRPVIFRAVDERGADIYHTNVVMCIGTKFATLCLDAVRDDEDQEQLLGNFAETGHKVIAISYDQMRAFAGNMIELQSKSGNPVVVLSETAFNSLLPGQVDAISRYADMLPIPIPTIEKIGGGSVRCMITGIYLPKRTW